ncbi:MAG TPA: translation initiation factor IF-3 [Candidatus Limnocylindrales bacterium]
MLSSPLDWRPERSAFARRSTGNDVRSKGSAIARDLRVNQMIRIPQVRVVDEEGAQLGVMPTPQALAMAQERGLDLVEVAPMAAPPVVKFLDFGQYKYELTKREKENKRRQRSVTFKEVRLSPKIGQGDFDTKVNRAIEFLEDGDRIKVTVRFRGRELTHPELGRNMLAKFTDRIKEHGVAERAPLLEGKSMHLTVASVHKPKEHEVPARPPKGGDQPPAGGEAAPAPVQEPAAATAAAAAERAPAAAAQAAAPPASRPAAPAAEPATAAAASAGPATNRPSAPATTPAATGE